jgi:hypothetical protein
MLPSLPAAPCCVCATPGQARRATLTDPVPAPPQVRTARVPAPSFRVASSHFLDSSVLHEWLKEYQDAILADAGGCGWLGVWRGGCGLLGWLAP